MSRCFVYTLRHPDTGQPERASETLKHATRTNRPGEAVFHLRTFRGTTAELRSSATGYNLPGGVPERQKRGKEKVVTRAVAYAEMKFSGTSERGYTVLMNRKIHWSSNFLIIILWRV